MKLRPLIRFLRAGWLLIGAFAIAGIAIAGGYIATQTPQYEAAAKVYVESTGSVPELIQGPSLSSHTRQIVDSYANVATAPIVLNAVIKILGLNETASGLRNRVSATARPDQVVIDIRATDQSAQRAADIANAVSRQLVKTAGMLTPSGASGPEVKLLQLQAATPPLSPSAPDTPVVLVLGLLIGAALGMLAAALRDRGAGGTGVRMVGTPQLT